MQSQSHLLSDILLKEVRESTAERNTNTVEAKALIFPTRIFVIDVGRLCF